MEMLRERVADGSLLRLVGRCLHVGILDGEEYSEPEGGTVQGSSLSPLLGNVYLHHVLDLGSSAKFARGCEARRVWSDAPTTLSSVLSGRTTQSRVMAVIGPRFERFGLRLHPDKTRLLSFARPQSGQTSGKGPATFDFLWFTIYRGRTRRGRWVPAYKTRKARHRVGAPVSQGRLSRNRTSAGHIRLFGTEGYDPRRRPVRDLAHPSGSVSCAGATSARSRRVVVHQLHESPFGEVRVPESSVYRGSEAQRPDRPTAGVGCVPRQLPSYSERDELPCHRTLGLPVSELDRAQPSPRADSTSRTSSPSRCEAARGWMQPSASLMVG